MPKQPEHTRVINGKRVLVNPGAPKTKKAGSGSRVSRPPVGGLTDLTSVPEVEPADYHIADLEDLGLHTRFVSDDDGGGLVFTTENYLKVTPSVFDPDGETELESSVSALARNAGLGGVEIIGNRSQWIKVYDNEGHPFGQNGYVSEEDLHNLLNFNKNLVLFADQKAQGEKDV